VRISSRNAPKGWKRPFDDPIPLPRGRQLVTLEDAARYIQKLPKAEQQLAEWQTAVENAPTMIARIGVMRALNHHVERVRSIPQAEALGAPKTSPRPLNSFFRGCADNGARVAYHARCTSRRRPQPRRRLFAAPRFCLVMHGRIGMLSALNRHVERVFNPDRNDTHWGKRKLKRDQ
jgi:hypothetical protein